MTEYAGLVSRSAAYVVDALIVATVTGVSAITFGVVAAFIGAEARELARIVLMSYLLALPPLLALYCALFWALAGRTPGMAFLGIRVVAADGRPPRWLAALVRGLLLAYLPILALWLLVDRRQRGLHDRIARTMVVRAITRQG